MSEGLWEFDTYSASGRHTVFFFFSLKNERERQGKRENVASARRKGISVCIQRGGCHVAHSRAV